MADLSNNPFARNQVNNQLNNTLSTADWQRGKAQLIVFPPRRIPDQVKRAHLYQFTGDFMNDLSDNVETALTGCAYNNLMTYLPKSVAARSSITPDANGIPIQTSRMSDFWMFILIIDHNPTNALGAMAASNQKRNIYSGWCAGEPATRTQNTINNWAINFNCVLSFTHDTSMIMRNTLTQGGQYQQLDINRDVDYLPGQILGMISRAPMVVSNNPFAAQPQPLAGVPLYEATPASVRNCTVVPENQTGSFGFGAKPIDSETNITISSSLNSPTKHLGRIVSSLVDTVKQTTDPENELAGNRNQPFFHSDPSTAQSVFTSLISQAPGGMLGSLDASKPMLIAELDKMFNLHVQVIEPNSANPTFDTAQSIAPTRKNILTDIITNSMQTCLIDNGLGDIIFSYSSWVPNQNMIFGTQADQKGIFHIHNFSPLVSSQDPHRIMQQQERFKQYFEFIIAPIIKYTGGDFQVHVHASLAGITLVQLNLLDDVPDYAMVETNNLLGGINSPMVGPMSAVQTNAAQLYSAVENVCTVPFDMPPIDSGVYTHGHVPTNPFLATENSVQY